MKIRRSLLCLVASIAPLACKDSNTVAAPNLAPAASLAGTWSGSFSSNAPSCPAAPMTVTFTQDGADVRGELTTNACGPHGFFKARLSGNSLTGSVDLGGCTGGGVLGEVHGNVLSISIGDFYQPLLTENQVVIVGGAVTLSR